MNPTGVPIVTDHMPKQVLNVTAVQLKFRRSLSENVEIIRRFIAEGARAGSDVVLFPECALTGYNVDFDRLTRREVENGLKAVAEAARAHRCHVLIGSPTFSRGRRFNSLVVFDRQGREKFRYHKIHLTPRDAKLFIPGNSVAFFRIDGVPCTAIICHERRFPELVRLPVMMGAQIVFHPNAGLDALAVSKTKRGGRDGIAVRAFENQVYYVFANSVGPQGGGLWSAGDSKIVAPDSQVLALANNRDEMLIQARFDLSQAGRNESSFLKLSLDRPDVAAGHHDIVEPDGLAVFPILFRRVALVVAVVFEPETIHFQVHVVAPADAGEFADQLSIDPHRLKRCRPLA
ncbi:MAG TPA: carbon-nitrogen hydrolase family protein [Desulfuromonadaceae bacterium]|jgi:predicted amidohydrolase|nr:carbon-nitrogen hydrolase family protein [Desulfuromonadaceae bacterium]